MKTNITTILFFVLFASFSNAQTVLDKGVNEVLEALSTGTTNFTDIKGALDNLKTQAQQEFEQEQTAINTEQKRLDDIQAEIDKDKDREAQMMYDEWVERAKVNTKLMRAREELHERELRLAMKKVVFKDQIKQAEQKLLSTLANHLKEQLDYHNSRMNLLKEQLKEVENMQKQQLNNH